jgi:outer membrane lipoprotein-sorting protein
MKKIYLLIFILSISEGSASIKKNIIQNLNNINNLTFNFEQNINGEVENGNCSIEYPKKIYCKYMLDNKKILVSNGKSLVIKTSTSYYIYPLEKTPLSLILDKNFLLNNINKSKERLVDNKFINFSFFQNDNEVNIFFDKNTYNLVGWQTLDVYQNLSITYLFSIIKNQKLNKNLFILPKKN